MPECPLCGAPISIAPGVDPNVPMDAHLTSSCPVLDPSTGFARGGAGSSAASSSSSLSHGSSRPKKGPDVCAFGKCSTRMIVPMRCAGCGRDFCTPHRFAADHACKGKTLSDARPAKARAWDGKLDVRFLNDPQKRAALSAVKRKLMPPTAPDAAKPAFRGSAGTRRDPIVLDDAAPVPVKASSSDAKSMPHLPKLGLGKVDRRAKAEEESRRRALEMRARKGCACRDRVLPRAADEVSSDRLLTEQEKVQYATELALLHGSSSSKKDDCLVS